MSTATAAVQFSIVAARSSLHTQTANCWLGQAARNRLFHSTASVLGVGQRPPPRPQVQPNEPVQASGAGVGAYLSGLGVGDQSGAGQAFLRSRWPFLALLGFGAAGALAWGVLREPVVTQRVWLDFEVDGQPAGRVVVGLFGREAPQTCDNFAALASHELGFGYQGCPVHRVMHGWSVWSGDVTAGDGSGGVAAFGPSLPLETLGVRHRRGSVSMVMDEEGRLRSQFFFTMVTTPALDRKAAAFGRVLEGMEVLDRLSRLPTHEGDQGRPRGDVRVRECGLVEDAGASTGEGARAGIGAAWAGR